MILHPISAFNDNYIWALYADNGGLLIVDPGDANPVIDFIETHELTLKGILITHHHFDHIGGIQQLVQTYGEIPVYGPEVNDIPHCTTALSGYEIITDGPLGLEITVLPVPGHTLGHIAYFIDDANTRLGPILFCGDALFSCGCGRIFEGSPDMMWSSLQALMELPDATLVCPAHEYTQSNVEFCLAIKPEDEALLSYHQEVLQLRKQNKPTLPSTLALEKSTSLFLRVEDPAVQQSIADFTKAESNDALSAFTALRQAKDSF